MLGLLTWTIIEAPEAGWTSTQTVLGFGVSKDEPQPSTGT